MDDFLKNNVIGPRRTLILAILVALNAAAFFLQSSYLEDENLRVQRQHNILNNEIRNLRRDTADILEKSEELQAQVIVFDDLINDGFLNDQNRVTVRDSFNLMASLSRLIDADYDVSRASVIEAKQLKDAGYNILKSEVSVSVSAVDDIKIYNFLHLIANRYPGVVNIKSIALKKDEDVEIEALRGLNPKTPKPFASAEIRFEWISVSGDDPNKPLAGTPPGSGRR